MEPTNPEAGSLTRRAGELQVRQAEFHESFSDALKQVASAPSDALGRIVACEAKADALVRDQEQFLREMGDWGLQQLPQLHIDAEETRLQLLYGRGQAHFLLGHLAEARTAFEQALTLVGDRPHMAKPMLRMALAQVATEQ
jgi:protein involved in temperature-dependent protein secretion